MTRKYSLLDRRFPKTNLNNSNEIDITDNERNLSSKIDRRTTVDHTFTTTDFETFNHTLGRIPKGFTVIDQDKAAVFTGDRNSWTKKTIKIKSSVTQNATRIQLI